MTCVFMGFVFVRKSSMSATFAEFSVLLSFEEVVCESLDLVANGYLHVRPPTRALFFEDRRVVIFSPAASTPPHTTYTG